MLAGPDRLKVSTSADPRLPTYVHYNRHEAWLTGYLGPQCDKSGTKQLRFA
jgi:hypothetical protein